MPNVAITRYSANVLYADVDTTGVQGKQVLFGNIVYIGMSILKGGQVYDFPVGTMSSNSKTGVAWSDVPSAYLENSTIVIAFWDDFPSPTAHRLFDKRFSGAEVLEKNYTSPVEAIGNVAGDVATGIGNVAGAVGNAIPMILLIAALAYASEKGSK